MQQQEEEKGVDAFDLSEPVNLMTTYGPEW